MPPPNYRAAHAEALLEHAGWMRKLALRLVGDSHRADDLAQETWVRALESPPSTDRPLRGWLATVMRNHLRQDRRGDARRRERDARVALDPEASGDESGADVLERVLMQRELVEHVLALEEPYQTTVLLRYFEELAPRDIAKRQRVPVATVKTRLARGLERLRERMNAEHGGDGKAWVLALAPVLRKPAGLAPASSGLGLSQLGAGTLAVNVKALLVVLLVTGLAVGYYYVRDTDPQDTATTDVSAAPRTEDALAAGGEERVHLEQPADSGAGVRDAVEVPEVAEEPTVEPALAEGVEVRGRVVDTEGRPVGGVAIVPATSGAGGEEAQASAPLGLTSGDGTFLVRTREGGRLVVGDDRYATVLAAIAVDAAQGKQPIVVVAPRVDLAGQVVDELGAPVAGAALVLAPAETLRADLGWVLDYSLELPFRAKSGADGRFTFEDAPGFARGTLRGRADGHVEGRQPAPQHTSSSLVLVLPRQTQGERLTGIVVDPGGLPVADASVSMGMDTTTTDETGAFSFDLADPEAISATVSQWIELEDVTRLVAIKPGYLPGELEVLGRDEEGAPKWPAHLVIHLGGKPLVLEGRVVGDEGEPREGMRVWIETPTFFGARREEGRRFPRMMQVETELAGLEPSWPYVETDADGAFRLEGLMDREYTIEAMDPVTLMRVREHGVRPDGRRLELVLSQADAWEVLRGRVVDGRGEPVQGANVRLMCDAYRSRAQGQVLGTRHAAGMEVTSDDQGRFEVLDVPKDDVYFRVDHPDTIPLQLGRSEQSLRAIVGESHEDFLLTVMRRCHFQIALDDAAEADQFEMHDVEGNALQLSEFQGNGRRDGDRFAIVGGRTNVLAVGDAAATLVLYKDSEVVKRVPVELRPGEQETIRP